MKRFTSNNWNKPSIPLPKSNQPSIPVLNIPPKSPKRVEFA